MPQARREVKTFLIDGRTTDECLVQAGTDSETDTTPDSAIEPTIDPTTASIEGGNAERTRLRAEVLRLSEALVGAYTDSQAVSAERDQLRTEANRLKTIGETMFVEGYDQAVVEIRDHFRKAGDTGVVAEIEKIWLQDKLS